MEAPHTTMIDEVRLADRLGSVGADGSSSRGPTKEGGAGTGFQTTIEASSPSSPQQDCQGSEHPTAPRGNRQRTGLLDQTVRASRRTAKVYLALTAFLAVFSTVYEVLGHGVYSWWMILLAAWSSVGGVAVWAGFGWITRARQPDAITRVLHHCGLATLIVGSALAGVLEIYGTTSPFVVWFAYIGAAMIVIAWGRYLDTQILH